MSEVKVATERSGEVMHFGPTTIRILEDGSGTDNRVSAITSMMPPHVNGPPPHVHLMHDESFLITTGVLRFKLQGCEVDAKPGDYVVVPVGAPHSFDNVSDEAVTFFTTFTPAFYIESFRESAKLVAEGKWNEQTETEVLIRYATQLCDM
jgi:mannose-6-phosphate isomerase-like protein (cupin superfamily)